VEKFRPVRTLDKDGGLLALGIFLLVSGLFVAFLVLGIVIDAATRIWHRLGKPRNGVKPCKSGRRRSWAFYRS
jgi:hypothetical protein